MSFKRASVNDIKRAFEKIKDKFLMLSKVAFSGKYTDLTGTPELGSSAYAHIVDNRTTNVKGFVPDATQLAEMQAEIDEMNSTLDGIGAGNGYSGELAFIYTQNEYANANDLPVNSLAYTFTSASNIPSVINGSHILTIGNKNLRIQICFSRSDNFIYVRDNLNGSWKAWKKITTS